MSTLKIKIANFFAKGSCSAWQSSRTIRRICRKIYRTIMETGARDYPYVDTDFAYWPESNGDGTYSLITDSADFVIRRSPSYVAWRMKQTTGKWPKLPTPGKRIPGENDFDAKHWDEVLEFNGWTKVDQPICDGCGTHFVGVIPNFGDFGQVVWFESDGCLKGANGWITTTYKNFHKLSHFIPIAEKSEVIWYREPEKSNL